MGVEGRHHMSSRNKTKRQCYRGSKKGLGGRWIRQAYLESSITRGGILMTWDESAWKAEILEIG